MVLETLEDAKNLTKSSIYVIVLLLKIEGERPDLKPGKSALMDAFVVVSQDEYKCVLFIYSQGRMRRGNA